MHHSTISFMDQEPHFLAQHKIIESRNSATTVQAVCELWPDLHRKVPRMLLLGPPARNRRRNATDRGHLGSPLCSDIGRDTRLCIETPSHVVAPPRAAGASAEWCGCHAHRLLPH